MVILPSYKNLFKATHLLSIFFVLSFCACDPKKNEDPKKVADQHNDAKFNNSDKENDAHFLSDASAMCLQQVKLAKLAQQNSIRPEVQQKGKVLETEYVKILTSIRELAKTKSITLPQDLSNDQKKIYNDLSFEISADFDRKYFERISKDHAAIIDEYKKAQQQTHDADIKAFVNETLPVVAGNAELISTYTKK